MYKTQTLTFCYAACLIIYITVMFMFPAMNKLMQCMLIHFLYQHYTSQVRINVQVLIR